MKKNLKKIGVILVGVILLIGVYICFLNITCPIKGTYVYSNDKSVTLQFKNGMYIFKGEGYAYDNLVDLYGNYVRCSIEEIKQQDNVYNPISKTKEYNITTKNEDLPISVNVQGDGTLTMSYSFMSNFHSFYKLEK